MLAGTSTNIGVPFARVAPIFVGTGEGVLKGEDNNYLQLKYGTRSICAHLRALSSLQATGNINTDFNAIKDLSEKTLRKIQKPAKEDIAVLLKDLKVRLSPEQTITSLIGTKNSLIGLLNACHKDSNMEEILRQAGDKIESFEQLKETINGIFSEFSTSYPKAVDEAQRLRFWIDGFTSNPRPPKEVQDHIIFRCRGAVNGLITEKKLNRADEKEKKQATKFKELTENWNQLSLQTTEINALIQAIDTVKPVISNLVTAKVTSDKIQGSIHDMLQAYYNLESDLLSHEFDCKSHAPKLTTFQDLLNLGTTYQTQLEGITGMGTPLATLLEYHGRIAGEIENALAALKSAQTNKKTIDESNKLFKHAREVEDLFADTVISTEEFFKELERDLRAVWYALKGSLEEARTNLKFLTDTSKFTGDIATLYVKYHEIANKLRDQRISANTKEEYSREHESAVAAWTAANSQFSALASQALEIQGKFTDFQSKASASLTGKVKNPDELDSLKEKITRNFQREFKIKYDNLCKFWNISLPTISSYVAQEFNRGVKAMQEKDYETNFKDAFGRETTFLIVDRTNSLINAMPWTASATAENSLPHYTSPFAAAARMS